MTLIFCIEFNDVSSADAIQIHGVTTTDVVKPGVVTNIQVTSTGKDSAKLTWTAPEDTDVAGYRIYQNGVKIGESETPELPWIN